VNLYMDSVENFVVGRTTVEKCKRMSRGATPEMGMADCMKMFMQEQVRRDEVEGRRRAEERKERREELDRRLEE